MRITDVLRRKGDNVVSAAPEETVRTLLDRLAEHRIGAVLVLDPEGGVAGIVSERDVVRQLQQHGPALLDRAVSEIMTSEVHTCPPEATIDELMVVMTENRFRHIPVLRDGNLCGIVSIGDVVKLRIEELQSERDHLTAYITG
jgi:CBS domain-containing protein